MRRRLFGDDDGAPAIMRTLNSEADYGAIWSRPGLAIEDRMVCALAALGAVQRLKKPAVMSRRRSYLGHAGGRRSSRIPDPDRHPYAGFAARHAIPRKAVEAAAASFAERGCGAAGRSRAQRGLLEALSERGRKLMEQLHGDRAGEEKAPPRPAMP